ncbi:hypothetical protein SUDANB70_05923 [Streptomyces sp. enrichment culture]
MGACVRVLGEVHRSDGYPVNRPRSPRAWLTGGALVSARVAESDGRVSGHVALSRSGAGDAAPGLWSARTGADAGAAAVVGRLFVDPRARGRGTGVLLMAQAVAEARRRGLHPVLDVPASDTATVALHERLGRRPLGTVEQEWGPRLTVTVRCFAAPPDAAAGPAPGATRARRSS